MSAWPPGGGPSETIRPLDSSITRSATRAISRLWVTTSTVMPARGLLLEHAEDLDAGAEVELTGRLVGEQDRVPGRERAGDRDALLLAARELVREVAQTVSERRPARAPAAPAPLRRCPCGVGAELARSRAR